MTEKRFEVRLCSDKLYYFYIFDNETGKEYKYLIEDELLKLLNELHEENQYLKSLKWNQDCINEISIGIQQRQLLEEEIEQLKSDLKRVLPLILAIDFKISINECKAINRLCKLVEDDFIKSEELNKIFKKKEYPKRNPITYESVPKAIYNWDD